MGDKFLFGQAKAPSGTSVSGETKVNTRKDLAIKNSFMVKISGSADPLSCIKCQGLGMNLDYKAVPVGGSLYNCEVPENVKFNKVTLTKSVNRNPLFIKWMNAAADEKKTEESKQNVTIQLMNSENKPLRRWTLINARPESWQLSELSAEGGTIVTEDLTLTYEGLFDEIL